MQLSASDNLAALFAEAVARHQQGRVAEALALYDAAICANPNLAAAHGNRGLALQSLGRTGEALASYDRAIALDPNYADAQYNKAISLRLLKRLDEAVASYDRAIALNPGYAEAYGNRGNVLRELGRSEEALRSFDAAIGLRPGSAPDHFNRGNALQDLRRWNDALEAYDRAIALRPDFAQAWNNRANTLGILGRPEEALSSCDRAIELRPDFAEAHCSRGNGLKDLMRLDEALASYDRAIALAPGYADAYWNKSYCVLLMGDFEQGWPLYEWRKRKSDAPPYPAATREWSGSESLEGKVLVIYAEQGLGDTIQFCRYAHLALARGARVIFVVQRQLLRLLKSLGPDLELVPHQVDIAAFDHHVALLSLPGAFRTTPGNCPSSTPYLRAESERVAHWRTRLGTGGFKIGICWHGNRDGGSDFSRSIAPHHFEPLARIPGVRLISLQKTARGEQMRELPPRLALEFPGDDFDAGPDAFVDTAAVMENLDLVITSDTALAHLAGALARPVWLALKQVPDWRWLLHGKDTFWYPTMRLFRQTRRGDWAGVFAAIEAELRDLLERRAPASSA